MILPIIPFEFYLGGCDHRVLDPEPAFSEEEVRGALEISASTGKFWYALIEMQNSSFLLH